MKAAGEPKPNSSEVTDDGPGFDPSAAHGGIGLQNMHDRLGALDGHVAIITAPGEARSFAAPSHWADDEAGSRPATRGAEVRLDSPR